MKMGCSSSLSLPLHQKKTSCNEMLEHNRISNVQTVKSSQTVDHTNNNTYPNTKQVNENIRIDSTEIVIYAHDARDSQRLSDNKNMSTDSSSVVPIINNDSQQNSALNNDNSCLNEYSDLRKETTHKDANSNNVHGVKSVLKTHQNNISNHMIANRPIKSVTFVESVTVVTVY